VRSKEKMISETLYKNMYVGVLEYEIRVEATSKHQKIYTYHSQGRHTHGKNTIDSKHGRRPIHYGSMKALSKDMATKNTLWIHISMTQLGHSHERIHSGATT
jgi:hypothetical protein